MTSSQLTTLYSIIGKSLGLAIVGAEAYAQAKTGGASSLLEPTNLATLIAEAEGVIIAPSAAPAAPAAVAPAVVATPAVQPAAAQISTAPVAPAPAAELHAAAAVHVPASASIHG